MGQDNYKFRYDAYKNNTFDLEVVERSLDESKMSGYQYLRQFQIDSTGYKRFDFGMREIYKTNNVNHDIALLPRRWVFFIEHEFINVGKRLAYKRSNLYEKDLSFSDISNRPDLFDSTFLVFINGKLYTRGIKVLCKEDKTYIIFLCKEDPSPEGFSMKEMKEYIKTNAKVTIYFIPNIGIKNISTNAYRMRTLNNGNGLATRNLGLTDYVDYNNSLSFLRPVNEIYSIPTKTNIENEGLYINSKEINEIIETNPNNTAMDIQLIPLRHLLQKIEINGEKWFEIPMKDYPIAVENCIVMDEDGLFVHDATINHYYPNIYELEGIDDIIAKKKLIIYVFYYENKVDKLKHLDMLAAYHKYVPDYLERYKNGTINPLVKNFNPKIVKYSIKDYRKGLMYNENFTVYIKNSNGIVYKIFVNNGYLYTEEYNGIDKNDSPDCYYVLDTFNSNTYKIYMIDDVIYSERTEPRDYTDIIYSYDEKEKAHMYISTENGVLALYEYLQYSDHFKYKVLKMKEFIKADANNFRRYLRNLGLGNNYYYVDVSKIDLSQRKRKDNIDTKLLYKAFDKDMYMFVFRNDFRGMYDELLIHVDGTRYDKEVYICKANMLDYVYIPCELIKPDSILEIEKVCDTKKVIPFRSQDKSSMIKLDIGEVAVRNKTLYNDLFIVDKETGEYLDKTSYQIILPVKFHMDDIESDIVLDYIITETESGYYQLAILDHGLIEIYKDDEEPENSDNAFYLAMQDNKNDFYQFDMTKNNARFNKVDSVNGYVINKIRAMDDKNLIYQFKMVDGKIRIEIAEDDGTGKRLAEGGLNLLDIDEVFLQCPREIKIKINDNKYINRDLALYIKKKHNIQFIDNILTEDTYEEDNFNPIPFKTNVKKDSRYFRIYQNGRLIPRHLGIINFPNYNISGDAELFPGFIREPNVDYKLAVETMPYMMKQVCYLESIPRDKVINLKGLIDKPFDFKWYDVYLNGRKLVRKEVEIVSANIIKILKTESLQNLEIIENSRDKEYFGSFEEGVYDIIDEIFENDKVFSDNLNDSVANNKDLNDTEEDIVKIPISALDYIIRAFYNFLTQNFGLINPDELQISKSDIARFDMLLNPNEPFGLGFDILGENRKPDERIELFINPDEE